MINEKQFADATVLLSAVVPCYNEEQVLSELYNRLTAACSNCVGEDYEIVLINDGSRDQTWPIIRSLTEKDPHIVGVNLARNHGHQLALTAGLSVCRGERILVVDADLQDPPELVGEMWALVDQGADVVYGQRKTRSGETWFKKASAFCFYRILQQMTDVDIPADTGDFRLMTRRVLETLQSMPEQHRFIRGMVTWIGYKQIPLVYDRAERFAGETKYPLKKMVQFALDAVTGFSTRPLRIASHVGMLFGVLALLVIGYVIYGWSIGETVMGWTSLMAVVLILGSANMLFLGVMGEYLGRLYMESKHRPLFIIEEVCCTKQGLSPARQAQAVKRFHRSELREN